MNKFFIKVSHIPQDSSPKQDSFAFFFFFSDVNIFKFFNEPFGKKKFGLAIADMSEGR